MTTSRLHNGWRRLVPGLSLPGNPFRFHGGLHYRGWRESFGAELVLSEVGFVARVPRLPGVALPNVVRSWDAVVRAETARGWFPFAHTAGLSFILRAPAQPTGEERLVFWCSFATRRRITTVLEARGFVVGRGAIIWW